MKCTTLHIDRAREQKHSVTGRERLSKTVELYLHDGNIFIFTNTQALTQPVGKDNVNEALRVCSIGQILNNVLFSFVLAFCYLCFLDSI